MVSKNVKRFLAGTTAAAGAAIALLAPGMAAADWQPTRPVEFIIQTPPGGGSDMYARLWIGLIERYSLSPVPFVPVNMPGGAGAVSMAHMAAQRGDPHFITPTLNSLVTTAMQQPIPVMYPSEDLTPIAKMLTDPFWLVTNPANIGSWEEFVQRCQNDRLTATGTGSRSEDEIQIALLEKAAGCQPFRYVPAGGGGEVASQVAGGHVDFNVNQPSEAMAHIPERLIPIVQFVRERNPAFPDVPTHWELNIGTDMEAFGGQTFAELLDIDTGLHQMRGVMGTPGMPAAAVAWYENLFRQIFETPEWQDFMALNAMKPVFLNAEEYTEFLRPFEDNHLVLMRDMFGWDLRPDLRQR